MDRSVVASVVAVETEDKRRSLRLDVTDPTTNGHRPTPTHQATNRDSSHIANALPRAGLQVEAVTSLGR